MYAVRQPVKIEAPGSPDLPAAFRYPVQPQPGYPRMNTNQLIEQYAQPHPAYSHTQPPSASFSFLPGAQTHWPVSAPGPSNAQQHPHPHQQHVPIPSTTPVAAGAYGSAGSMVLPHITTLEDAHRVPSDEYDEPDDERYSPLGTGPSTPSGAHKKNEKEVRRRSSKACDQCRKSKCKCERSSANEPCKNCVMLNTPCTFLGPSRKRGPPKGYIDAIEARLHQTEALIGILLDSGDARARTLFEDLSEDQLARDIIDRVDNSPYGCKGRRRDGTAGGRKPTPRPPPAPSSLSSTHPSNEWQDSVVAKLHAAAAVRGTADGASDRSASPATRLHQRRRLNADHRSPSPALTAASSRAPSGQGNAPPLARLQPPPASATSSPDGRSPESLYPPQHQQHQQSFRADSEHAHSPLDDLSGDDDDLTDAVGQLSLNEDAQVRWHGKASGLHLLAAQRRPDGPRQEGGIWHFPKARIWPPLPKGMLSARVEDDLVARLPSPQVQEHLLGLYFTYVHPSLPIVHKDAFLEDFKAGLVGSAPDSPYSGSGSCNVSNSSRHASPFDDPRPRRIPTILLFSMLAVAARYSSTSSAEAPLPPPPGSMWPAGDTYGEAAKTILDRTYASSRPCTVQALLLLGYREIGIGAMAQAWLYIGMAVRMAQDLGMHKTAERWQFKVGRRMFGEQEMQTRKRIWWACVIMDRYVSAYIGRPLAIFDHDFDQTFPSDAETEETEDWQPVNSEPLVPSDKTFEPYPPVPARLISCFNASAKLSLITGKLMRDIYAIKPSQGRYSAALRLEEDLDKWYLDLPQSIRYDVAAPPSNVPPPHVLTLHMQYWTTVLLLHRPFIRHLPRCIQNGEDTEICSTAKKEFDACVRAANHITSIVSIYLDRFCIHRCPVFLSYYVFTAGIMHVTTLTTYPDDPQSRIGLQKIMHVLKHIDIVWPSAGRAWELLRGSKVHRDDVPLQNAPRLAEPRTKRLASDRAEDDPASASPSESGRPDGAGYPSQSPIPGDSPSSAQFPYFASQQQYERWPADPQMSGYAGGLSTSALPQQYSTGLVDHRAPARQGGSSTPAGGVSGNGSGRYPQYWNDYSTLGQLGLTYGMQEQQMGPGGDAPGAQGQPASSYQPPQTQYDMFGHVSTSSQ
ncbi:hypothetical protein PUNSTDRAFT_49242 [Punctularia strigosozonata HHB-11173 SS5]|uniref:uncharacterized protein n=1 Tax=Punctularia strigosozonata (strain HHB-11173) TaxID=741275 RepID=UPI00044169B4|nr:uncharacterized protein PUNSTDRAFT_49242 [Punctularia strigosozonata HHB-11173 SS5]EIN14455.1 hypothetical protein PUNSTDRAFT_49242 [Punctularia strigosozonata HHB-11173 SS5]